MVYSINKSQQGAFMRVVFICSENKIRSKTAETIFSEKEGIEVKSAGTSNTAVNPVTAEIIAWADIVFCMESHHKKSICKKFKDVVSGKKIVVMGIEDVYDYMQVECIEIIKRRAVGFIPETFC